MDPGAAQSAAAAAASPESVVAGSPPPGGVELKGGASTPGSASAQEAQDWSQAGAAVSETRSSSSESGEAEDGTRCKHGSGRENDENLTSKPEESDTASTSPALNGHKDAQSGVEREADAVLTADFVARRSDRMFPLEGTEAVASGLEECVQQVTNKLIQLVWAHVQAWSDAHVNALHTAFGNFDRIVAAGWLLADAFDLPLMDREQALLVGLKVRYYGGKILKTQGQVKRQASKVPATAPNRQEQVQELMKTAMGKLETPTRETLGLPTATRKSGAAAQATGSRKRTARAG